MYRQRHCLFVGLNARGGYSRGGRIVAQGRRAFDRQTRQTNRSRTYSRCEQGSPGRIRHCQRLYTIRQ